MSQSPITPPSDERESGGKILVWALCSVVGMLAVAALVFVLIYENKNDKAESLLAEAKAHISSNDLDAAALCLRQAGIYSPEAKSLLAEVQGHQDKEREQFRERERVIKANQRITALLESARESLSNNAISDADKKANEALKIAESLAKGRLGQINEFFLQIALAERERRDKELAIQRAEKLATRVKEANADVERLVKKGRRQLQSLNLELAVGTAKKALLVKDATNHALAHDLVSDAEEALTEFKRPPREVKEFNEKCVVAINTKKKSYKGLGAGFVVGKDLVATNHHVVSGAHSIEVEFRDGKRFMSSRVLHSDPGFDIAIILVPGISKRSKIARLTTEVEAGDRIRALGHPRGRDWSVTSGIVSAIRDGKEILVEVEPGKVENKDGVWIQTDAFIDEGNSGGPAINAEGDVVGVSAVGKDGINWLTSTNNLDNVLKKAKEKLQNDAAATTVKDSPRRNVGSNNKKLEPPVTPAEPPKPVAELVETKVEYYENGQEKSEQHFKNGKRDGIATYWHENGQKQGYANYKDDKIEGLETWWYENGEKAQERHFDDGIIVSASTWKPDGQPCPETKVVDGSGIVVMYRENGQKRWEDHYKNGKQGLNTLWYSNGQKRWEGHYKNGELDGLGTYWLENGQKQHEAHYKNGKRDGLWTSWHENGQKRWEDHYKNGKQDGLETQWDKNGNKTLEIQFKDGKEISRKEF